MYPVCEFSHMGDTFTPTVAVSADHPMVAARPDLFTESPPVKPRKKEVTP